MNLSLMNDDGNPIERRAMISLPLVGGTEVYELNQIIPLEAGERVHWIRPVAVVNDIFEVATQCTIVQRGESSRGNFFDVIYKMTERANISIGDCQGRIVIHGMEPAYQMTFLVGITKQVED